LPWPRSRELRAGTNGIGVWSANQIQDYKPAIFDTDRNGHNCHCTFFFLALQRMGLAGAIWGRGRAGSPFGVSLEALRAPAELGAADDRPRVSGVQLQRRLCQSAVELGRSEKEAYANGTVVEAG